MASIKISELNEYTEVQDNDLFPVVDVANGETKKVKATNIGTGGKELIMVGDESVATKNTKLLIETDTLETLGTEVVNSLDGNETTKAPSVQAVNNKFNEITNDSGTLKLSDSPLTQYRKIGNVCTLKINNYTPLSVNAYANLTIGTLPENFRPLIYLAQPVAIKGSSNNALNGILLTITVNGTVGLQNWTGATINIAGLEGYIAYLSSHSNIETTSNASTVSNDEPINEEATI